MGTYPTSPRSAFIQWCVEHEQLFVDNAAAIGLSTSQANSFKSLTNETVDTVSAQGIAQDAAKSATLAASLKVNELRAKAAEMVRTIRTFAENTSDPDVYVIAQIPPPAVPQPLPPPGQPSDLRVELDPSSGALTLIWKCANPAGASGTSYIVRRRNTASDPWLFVGVTGAKRFVDETFNAGPDSVQYTIQGQRSDRTGPLSPIFIVNFGNAGGGFAVSTLTEGEGTGGGSQALAA